MAKILQVDYESGDFVVRVSPKNIKLLPQETQEHLKTANKEMLMAFKSCLDSALSPSGSPEEVQYPNQADIYPPGGDRRGGSKRPETLCLTRRLSLLPPSSRKAPGTPLVTRRRPHPG